VFGWVVLNISFSVFCVVNIGGCIVVEVGVGVW